MTSSTVEPDGKPTMTLIATCMGFLLVMFDTTAVNFALPSVSASFGAQLHQLQWVVDAYNIAFAALLITGGTLGDRYGRRRLFRAGILLFTAGSIACAASPDINILIASRVVQGVGAGLLLPQSLTILAASFPAGSARNRAMAAWSIVGGVGLAAGPSIGAAIVDLFSWRTLFWINFPIGVLGLWLTGRFIAESRSERPRALDPVGQGLIIGTLAATTYVIVNGPWMGGVVPTLVIGALAVAGAVGFVFHEQRHTDPMLPLGLLRRGQLPVASAVAACMTFGMFGLFMVVPIAFTSVRGVSVLQAGAYLMPLPAAFILLSSVAGRIATRTGPRTPMVGGTFLMGLGIFLFAAVGPSAPAVVLEIAFVLAGTGLALNTGPVMALAVSAVPLDSAGIASGVANTARMIGATLGVAVQGALLTVFSSSIADTAESNAVRIALAVGAGAEFLGMLIAIRFVRTPTTLTTSYNQTGQGKVRT